MVEPDRSQMTTKYIFWITKARDTHSEYVTLIAFLLQKFLFWRKPFHCVSSIIYCISTVWVWNLVIDIAGGKEAEGVLEHGVEENIWT